MSPSNEGLFFMHKNLSTKKMAYLQDFLSVISTRYETISNKSVTKKGTP